MCMSGLESVSGPLQVHPHYLYLGYLAASKLVVATPAVPGEKIPMQRNSASRFRLIDLVWSLGLGIL